MGLINSYVFLILGLNRVWFAQGTNTKFAFINLHIFNSFSIFYGFSPNFELVFFLMIILTQFMFLSFILIYNHELWFMNRWCREFKFIIFKNGYEFCVSYNIICIVSAWWNAEMVLTEDYLSFRALYDNFKCFLLFLGWLHAIVMLLENHKG